MSAQEFLRRVEQTGMVSEPLLAELRKRISDTHRNMRPEMLAKLLVDRGELTPAQARKLISVMNKPKQPPPDPPAPSEPKTEWTLADGDEPKPAPGPDSSSEDILESTGRLTLANEEPRIVEEEEEELRLADEEEELRLADEDQIETIEGILVDDEEVILTTASDRATSPPPIPPSTPEDLPPTAPKPVEPDPVLDDILGDPLVAASATEGARLAPRRRGLAGLVASLFQGAGRPQKSRWDSPLILLGGGALILLVAAGFGIFALLYSETADEVFRAGQDAYEGQAYGEAIRNFERFAQKFSQHQNASLARVRIEMARVRQFTDRDTDWVAALGQAKRSLPGIKSEPAFHEARSELAKLLPDIAAGLVDRAKQLDAVDQKQRALEQGTSALELVNDPEYMPTSVRGPQANRIEEIESTIQVVQRQIERAKALAATVTQIQMSIGEGSIAQAYRLRDELIRSYPLLSDEDTLQNSLRSLADKERDAVRALPSSRTPRQDDHPLPAKLSVVLSDGRGNRIEGMEGQVIPVLSRGAVYGLRATDGLVLWRRYVGYETSTFPQPVGRADRDLLIVDSGHGELQRIAADTGKLAWRLSCPTPTKSPSLYQDRAFVCCGSGADSMLLVVDVASGNPITEIQLPVGCASPPAVLADRKEIVVCGTHSSVYVLDAVTLKCKAVFTADHGRGGIDAAPVFVGNSLVIAENKDVSSSVLHVFSPTQDAWTRSAQPIALRGQVVTNPAVDGRRMAVATTMGELRVFESPIDGSAIREIAAVATAGQNVGPSYVYLDRSRIWLANETLGQFQLQATRGQLVSTWLRNRDDRFLNPLLKRENYLFHIRRRTGMFGATVAAVPADDAQSGGQPRWETDISVPAETMVSSSGEVSAVTKNGAMFQIGPQSVKTGVAAQLSDRVDPRLMPFGFSQSLSLSADQIVFAGPPPTSHIVVADSTGQLERIPLRVDPDRVTAPLVVFSGSLLAACDSGAIHMLNPVDGSQALVPFLPRLEPGSRLEWLTPAPIESRRFLVAEQSGRIYRIRADENQLVLEREASLGERLIAGLVTLGNIAYAVTKSGADEAVITIDGGKLVVGSQRVINGGLAWGPRRVGDVVMIAGIDGHVHTFDQTGRGWRSSKPVGPLAGEPLRLEDRFVVASTSGLLSVLDGGGRVVAEQQISEPLGSGPIAYKDNLLVAGWDGTLYILDIPK